MCAEENPGGIPLVELIFEWVLPMVGAGLTGGIVHYYGFPWPLLILAAPVGALVFQLAIILSLFAIAHLYERHSSAGDQRK